jgi:hypothetical protein
LVLTLGGTVAGAYIALKDSKELDFLETVPAGGLGGALIGFILGLIAFALCWWRRGSRG